MSTELHEQAMRATERLRGHIVRLDNESVIRLELAARTMLENGCMVLPPALATPTEPTKARALVTVYMADCDDRSFDEVVTAVRAAVDKELQNGGKAIHLAAVPR